MSWFPLNPRSLKLDLGFFIYKHKAGCNNFQMNKLILGIDPGINGGIVAIDKEKNIIDAQPIPTIIDGKFVDISALNWLIVNCNPIHTYIEKVSAMPKQGVVSMFNFGKTCGIIEALVIANKISCTMVTPQAWQKVMHEGLDKALDSKVRSEIIFKRLYPADHLKASDRCKKNHDGMVDALMIALYGHKQFVW